MIRILIAGSALALATPLAAQQASAPADTGPVAATAAGAANSEFAAYDTDKSGQLDESEFSAWFAARHQGHAGAAARASATDVTLAFNKADTDRNKTVSEQELGQFLAG